ncbi:hypothetical protein [Isoptericola cucumis]|uniref:DUF222 domain-containing protein n=1 Tax=Isoptericola cucumis TaxID=1776856 RepID=A0ABQ2B971_9MICO|nr:hypothetical protein [Isoptericola cucumis]GGI10997.1 hypothetical protein GCM10007368_34010 [Isoptericola cucumis]
MAGSVAGAFDALPMLGRGKHRNPKKGACFMELASFLAGERWSDHPQCTHPLLAMLARAVNDLTSDGARPRLAPLIPSVIGLTSDDPRWDVRIALHAAQTALPVAPADRQQTLAVAIIGAERMLDTLDDRPDGTLAPESADALAAAPKTAQWAYRFCEGTRVRPKRFVRDAAPSVVSTAVQGISEAFVPDVDARLYDLLRTTVDDARRWAGRDEDGPQLREEEWTTVVKPAASV